MLPADVELIEELRFRFQQEALNRASKPVDINRSEIVRAGIHTLNKLKPGKLYQALEDVEELKEGRRKKSATADSKTFWLAAELSAIIAAPVNLRC